MCEILVHIRKQTGRKVSTWTTIRLIGHRVTGPGHFNGTNLYISRGTTSYMWIDSGSLMRPPGIQIPKRSRINNKELKRGGGEEGRRGGGEEGRRGGGEEGRRGGGEEGEERRRGGGEEGRREGGEEGRRGRCINKLPITRRDVPMATRSPKSAAAAGFLLSAVSSSTLATGLLLNVGRLLLLRPPSRSESVPSGTPSICADWLSRLRAFLAACREIVTFLCTVTEEMRQVGRCFRLKAFIVFTILVDLRCHFY